MAGGLEFSAEELVQQQGAGALGDPFLVFRDTSGAQRLFPLVDQRISIGRSIYADVVIGWDMQVSSQHAQLERLGDDWVLVDDGLSRNGSFVNGERVAGRRRLTDRDVVCVGETELLFCAPFQGHAGGTIAAPSPRSDT